MIKELTSVFSEILCRGGLIDLLENTITSYDRSNIKRGRFNKSVQEIWYFKPLLHMYLYISRRYWSRFSRFIHTKAFDIFLKHMLSSTATMNPENWSCWVAFPVRPLNDLPQRKPTSVREHQTLNVLDEKI